MLAMRFSMVLLVTEIVSGAAPYAWQWNEIGYDASLDPVMWSRAFAQDTIRKSRYMQTIATVRHLEGLDKRGSKNLHRPSSHWTELPSYRVQGAQKPVHSDGGVYNFVRSGRKRMADYPRVYRKRGPKEMLHRGKRNKRNPGDKIHR